MAPDDQFLAVHVGDHRSGLEADEEPAEVVPWPVAALSAVDVGVERPGSHRTQIERGRTERAELLPPEMTSRIAVDGDERLAHISTPGRVQGPAIDEGSSSPTRLERRAIGLVNHYGRTRALGIERAKTRREPRETPRRVGRTVDRVDDHDDVAVEMMLAGLLAQAPEPGALDDVEGGSIGDQVAAVLTRSRAGQTPIGQPVERGAHGDGGILEHAKERGVINRCHRGRTLPCPAMAIREAVAGDVDEICGLIDELAAYEHLEDEVVYRREAVAQHLFGPQPVARVLLAVEEDGRVAGMALWYPTFSTFLGQPGIWLEDLFVRPQFRGQGHGGALLQRLRELTDGRVEWAVLDWNATAMEFYQRLGATPVAGWTRYRLVPQEDRPL